MRNDVYGHAGNGTRAKKKSLNRDAAAMAVHSRARCDLILMTPPYFGLINLAKIHCGRYSII